ncbi:MAG: hypothetical protein ABIO02_00685 [Patescibacteria group bacterium]
MHASTRKSSFLLVAAVAALAIVGLVATGASASMTNPDPSVMPGNGNKCVAMNGYNVCGRFLEYWEQNGGLAQQGYPIAAPEVRTSPTDGKTYTMQRMQRAWFELHPENSRPYDVLLSLLGVLYTGPQQGCQCQAETDPDPINPGAGGKDKVAMTLPTGWWDVEDTSCGGPGEGENKCHEFYPLYSDGTYVLKPYADGHMRAWKVRGGRTEANCTVLTEATQYAKEHPDYHVSIRQLLTDK